LAQQIPSDKRDWLPAKAGLQRTPPALSDKRGAETGSTGRPRGPDAAL